jgi:hypothetical protein
LDIEVDIMVEVNITAAAIRVDITAAIEVDITVVIEVSITAAIEPNIVIEVDRFDIVVVMEIIMAGSVTR